ncbi:Gti1/Pac2 family-domain-containing protein [Irpex lacteus]|nr:Gti1/Pac2 family-domain-containing protein [Irpex lacteus]
MAGNHGNCISGAWLYTVKLLLATSVMVSSSSGIRAQRSGLFTHDASHATALNPLEAREWRNGHNAGNVHRPYSSGLWRHGKPGMQFNSCITDKVSTNTRRFPAPFQAFPPTLLIATSNEYGLAASYEASAETNMLYRCSDGLLQKVDISRRMVKTMQPATCNGIRVRSTADCNVIFHAVSLGILPLVSRRLSIEERRAIQSGCVFVWEERSPTIEAVGDGLERWTDSRRWGASRLAKDFLLYQEKLPEVRDPHLRAAMHYNRLVKQTYSVWVDRPDGRRKWHLETGHHMATVDDVPQLARLRNQVPEGKFQAARCSKTRSRQDDEAPQPQLQPQPPPGGSILEFQAFNSLSLVGANGSGPGSNNSSPEIGTPASTATAHISPHAIHRATIAAPYPVLPPSRPRSKLEARSPAPVLSLITCLPKIAPPPPTRPDPEWVLQNYVAVSPIISDPPTRRVLGETSASKDMAPLVYMRRNPYMQRHPLDNDALRALDAMR